jgi:thymidylate synthase ThyX
MTIEAQVILDSVSPDEIRLTTFQLRYPRFIHAELMTHRVFSRNASSSRAIPIKKLIRDVQVDPAMPTFWGSDQPGMQAGAELRGREKQLSSHSWLAARDEAVFRAQQMVTLGLHKQIVNRILEPWAHINVVLTSTEFENFYQLRRHADAQPEMKVLADAIWQAQVQSYPKPMRLDEWHLPYIRDEDAYALRTATITRTELLEALRRISTARCARVSYLTHDGRKTTVEEDLALFDRLMAEKPIHASPAEHQATPDERLSADEWWHPEQHGNLVGWRQHRKMLGVT